MKKSHLVFSESLKHWFSTNYRPLPWKESFDPYFIWLSEVILQQTRVEQGLPYYQRFTSKYPTISDLAAASNDEIMKLWQGLGYYSRARNLHSTAKHVTERLDGVFPSTYKDLLALKGVGEYTAAAIASFAYGLPHAVVDGNVYRVLSRYFGIKTPIDSTQGKKEFKLLAQKLLDVENPGEHNQAMMDFGATQCMPKKPKCATCPLSGGCIAFNKGLVDLLPIKEKKIKRQRRQFLYFVPNFRHHIYIAKREGKDIWQDLYEFPLFELDSKTELNDKIIAESWEKTFPGIDKKIVQISKVYKQNLTHQTIIANFVEVQLDTEISAAKSNLLAIDLKKLKNFAFPKIITCFLNDKTLYLRFNNIK